LYRIKRSKLSFVFSLLIAGSSIAIFLNGVCSVSIFAQEANNTKSNNQNDIFHDPTIIVAIIAAFGSFVAAALTSLFGILNQKTLTKLQNESQTRIALLQEQIDIRKKMVDARTTYEFDARKRLYQECEPILFQLYERSDDALHRIYDLAKKSNNGEFQYNNGGPAEDSYTIQSTIFRLLSPIAAFKLLQRKLTFVDLKVDNRIRLQYELAKRFYFSFAADEKLSRIEPSIHYRPGEPTREEKGKHIPERYSNIQGIKAGIIDNLANELIKDPEGQRPRLMDFGEFQLAYSENEIFLPIRKLFLNFHPKTSPVLWRILIAQAHILDALLKTYDQDLPLQEAPKLLNIMTREKRARFDWRIGLENQDISDNYVLEQPFIAVETYLREYFDTYFE
jgi:hypothetical protein